MTTPPPEISLIVPLLNEAAELPGLFASLAAQEGISLEVILCDGGSSDGSQRLSRELATKASCAVHIITAPRGRGIQMNAGARIARGGLLLFLHADSRFSRTDALRVAVSTYRDKSPEAAGVVAARFRLRFRRQDPLPSLAYHFFESKARLNRADCIRGDQAYLISLSDFEQLGRFDEALPFLEDVRLAELVTKRGQWLLLPADISTSARRFEQEGFYERQVVNVIIINAVATGWDELLQAMPELYRHNKPNGRLKLFPLLDGVRRLIEGHDREWQRSFWRSTGRHVASNAWQLFFWLDVRRSFRSGRGPDEVKPRWLDFYEQHLRPCFESLPAAMLAEWLTRAWFRRLLKRPGQ
jgi:rSAM/selenodomain-associated transferase 2